MRHATIRILTLLLTLALASTLVLPAYGADIDLGVTVGTGDADSFPVDIEDAIPNGVSAKLQVPCSFTTAYVALGNEIIAGSQLKDGMITFPVSENGQYTVYSGTPFTVTFDSKEGSAVASQTVPKNGHLLCDDELTKEGFLFAGWYTDEDCTTAWDFEQDTVTRSMTLYAKWEPGILVTFNTNGGGTVASQTVTSGSKVTEPTPAPTKAGYRFDGWFRNSGLTSEWNFAEDTITAATTLYAKWTDIWTGTSDDKTAAWNVRVDAATLDAAANAQGSGTTPVSVRLTVKDLAPGNVPKAEYDAIDALAIGRALTFLDMKLEKTVDNGVTYTDIGSTNTVLQKITLDFDAANKSNIAVFRYHGGKAALLPQGTQGERFELDTQSNTLTIYAKHFSTYAIGYTSGTDTLKTYSFTKGNNSSWAKDSSRNLVFECNGPHSLLEKIEINDQQVSSAYAEATETGTKVTLKPDLLKTLPRGKYYLELYYANGGYAIAAFTVTRSSGIAYTRDLFNMTLWGSLLGISAIGVILLVIAKKRRK